MQQRDCNFRLTQLSLHCIVAKRRLFVTISLLPTLPLYAGLLMKWRKYRKLSHSSRTLSNSFLSSVHLEQSKL